MYIYIYDLFGFILIYVTIKNILFEKYSFDIYTQKVGIYCSQKKIVIIINNSRANNDEKVRSFMYRI